MGLFGDEEITSVVKELHPLDMYTKPYGIHVQSLTDQTDGFQTSITSDPMGVILEFSANLPDNTTVPTITSTTITITRTTVATTSTTTVSLLIDIAQCGRQEIAPHLGNNRIFGGRYAIPHSWPWIVSYEEKKLRTA